jgi:hypothetical protein
MDEEEKDVQVNEEVDDTVTDEVVLDEENDSVDDTDKTEQDDQESVPLSTYLELKSKYKSTKKEYQDLKDKTIDKDILEYKESIKSGYMKDGYNEDLADRMANDLAELKTSILQQQKTNSSSYIDEEIEELSSDPLFRDIGEYRELIAEKIKDTKKKGYDLAVEDAYVLVSKGFKSKLKDQRVNDTQRDVLNRKNKGTVKTNVATSNSTSTSPKYKLDADDKKALLELQKMQPNSKWTVEKYYKMRHGV